MGSIHYMALSRHGIESPVQRNPELLRNRPVRLRDLIERRLAGIELQLLGYLRIRTLEGVAQRQQPPVPLRDRVHGDIDAPG